MTENGSVGELWEVGSVESMVAAAERLLQRDRMAESARVRDVFARRLSFHAIGRDADAAYRSVITARSAA
jgi:hypothetical protein